MPQSTTIYSIMITQVQATWIRLEDNDDSQDVAINMWNFSTGTLKCVSRIDLPGCPVVCVM